MGPRPSQCRPVVSRVPWMSRSHAARCHRSSRAAKLALSRGDAKPSPQRGRGGEQEDGEQGLVHDAEQGISADGEEDGPVHDDVGEDDDDAQDGARSPPQQEQQDRQRIEDGQREPERPQRSGERAPDRQTLTMRMSLAARAERLAPGACYATSQPYRRCKAWATASNRFRSSAAASRRMPEWWTLYT